MKPLPQIEKGIPIPESTSIESLLNAFEPGDSAFFEGRTVSQMSVRICRIKKEFGKQFTSRTVTENEVKGVRVWRVS